MAFLIGGANSASGGYEVSNSLRVEADDSPKLSKTVSTATNTTKMTLSLWYKLGEPADMAFLSKFADSDNRFHLRIMAAGHLLAYNNVAGTYHYKTTTAQFRDPSAWYNFVFVYNTDDSTAADRVKIYANGVRLTSFVNNTNPGDGEALKIASDTSNPLKVLCSNDEDAYLSGCVSDFYYIDGDNRAPTDFGEYDGSSGIWKPKEYTGGFGNNGFKLEFKQVGVGTASASTVGADTSGNDHHLTSANIAAIDIITDSPTNNFCTMSPVAKDPNITLTEGNLKFTSGGSGGVVGTQAVANGKWYWEVKAVDTGADCQIGIWDTNFGSGFPYNQYVGVGESWGYINFNGKPVHNGSQGSAITTIGDADIVMMALDMDNLKMWFGINGTWLSSGDPAAGSGEQHSGITDSFMTPAIASFSGTSGYDWQFNFGNPIYANSSSQADDNGYGDFEYDVPTGFYSLCTKNLAEYG